MKKLISIALAHIFLLQGGIRLYIIVDYNIRKEYIAANWCENRNNPDKHCQGSCYLKKRLHKEGEKESSLPYFLKEKGETILFFLSPKNFQYMVLEPISWTDGYRVFCCLETYSDIFHPPPTINFITRNS